MLKKNKALIAKVDEFYSLTKLSYIKQIGDGKWRVFSESGKNLGTYNSKEKAEKRLKQIEMFKHMKKKKASKEIDLSKLKYLTYASVMRELNKQSDRETMMDFACLFKTYFDQLTCQGEKEADQKALIAALTSFQKTHNLEVE